MFARIAALGALALLMTVPAASASSLANPLACAANTMQAAPYNGFQADTQALDNLAACTYRTHDAEVPEFRLLFVPYVPNPAGDMPQFGLEFVPYLPFLAEQQDPLTPQTLPAPIKSGSVWCKADQECRTTQNTQLNGDENLLRAEVEQLFGGGFVCAQVYPYSMMCTAPNAAYQLLIFVLEA